MLSKRAFALACAGLFLVASSGCSPNPEQAKRDYVERGDAYMKGGNADAAVIEYRNAVQQDARFGEAYQKLAAAYGSRGDSANAMRAAVTAADLLPEAKEAQIEAGRLLLLAGELDEARMRAEGVLKTDSENVAARALRENAIAALKQQDLPLGPAARQAQEGSRLLGKNDSAGALAAFNRAIALDPFHVEALAGLTTIDFKARRSADALARLDGLLDRAPKNAGLLLIAAGAYSSARDLSRAETLLVRAIDADPGLLAAYAMLGRVYLAQDRLDAARTQFEKLAKEQDRPVGALTLLGVINQMQNRIPDAQQAFERALKADPRAAVAANNLAWIYAENGGSLDAALRLAEMANTALPNQAEVSDTLGWVYFKKGQLPAAIRALEHGLNLDPSNATTLYHLALAHEKSGNQIEARRLLERYLTLDPQSDRGVDVRRRLKVLGTQGGSGPTRTAG
jgi:tetratricopeptide (TPR) repeat protein